MSLAGRQCRAGKRGEGAAVDCCSCVSFVWLQELGKWAHPLPSVSSVGFQVSIFNTNLHPHSSAKDRSEPNNFGYYVKNHKKSPKFNALWPFFPAIYKYLFTISQFFSIFYLLLLYTFNLISFWSLMRTRDEKGTAREWERERGGCLKCSTIVFLLSLLPPWLLGPNFLGRKGPTGVATLPLCWPANCASGLKCWKHYLIKFDSLRRFLCWLSGRALEKKKHCSIFVRFFWSCFFFC